ncbi:nuclease-related domain-containing protein [Bacillus canaveralius]|uniref:nuclease-related domain-containing protein n=1 Tax=Bacillus canaveralius TaxID=1403243 RepID=UPI000F79C949|nr:nuclease-related domain-containing protein [Bacillus canaveralius]RSK54610.1 NERD domain-containing protein [Bacillus canaveralius]
MIVKRRTVPLKIQVGEALLRRLPEGAFSREELQGDLERRRAGYWGEQSIDHYLSFLDEKKYLIFHDLNLPRGEYTFQIDTLLLTANLAIILEVKNIAGTLFFDQLFHQLIRTNANGKEEGFPDPITQASLQKYQLNEFLHELQVPDIPIEYAVVICNKHSILKTNPGQEKIFRKVFKTPHLLNWIQALEKVYPKEVLSSKELRKISRQLIKKNTPPRKLFLDRYLTSKDELITGVYCPFCFYIPMQRMKRHWHCPDCSTKSRDAHMLALRDYFLLIDSKISNQQFRDFAQLSSRDIASRLLISTNFPSSGTTKGRFYFPPADLFNVTILDKKGFA